MTGPSIRLAEYVVLAVAFGAMAVDLGRGFWADHGAPWNRRPGADGRWRTDGLVVVLVAAISLICAVATVATLFEGWAGARGATTALLGLLAVTVVGVWLSGKAERRRALAEVDDEREGRAVLREERSVEREGRSVEREERAVERETRAVERHGDG